MQQLHVGLDQPQPGLFNPIRNPAYDHANKPGGGLWTSTWITKKRRSHWVEWCRSEEVSRLDGTWWLLTPSADARIYTIDTRADLLYLLSTYWREGSVSAWKHRWIDWEKLSSDYDAVHLTRKGSEVLHSGSPDLNCWDVESTVWLHWVFSKVAEYKGRKQNEPNTGQ